MSARSSSGSWSGAGAAAPDIIDLDKFMRGGVRPSRRLDTEARNLRDQLVVDAGGVERKLPVALGTSGAGPAAPPGAPVTPPAASTSSDSTRHKRHAKRFSHDSGLSDGSYAQRKHRPHRRTAETARAGGASAGAGSTASLRAFRAVCERALLDQQAQIARVAQLCERLTERQAAPATPPRRSDSTSPRTSDVTSTSRSTRTRDPRRKDKHRMEECKTYKIIMNKLDELNRRFAARAASPGVRPARRREPSSGSVSMSDKLVYTEPALLQTSAEARGGGRRPQGLGLRTVTNTCMLDIAPKSPPIRNVTTESDACGSVLMSCSNLVFCSVVECDSGPIDAGACDARCGFDLEDPIHLYSQAKRLQALPASRGRSRSAGSALESRASERRNMRADTLGAHVGGHVGAHAGAGEARETSLCALCRGYWRSLRQYLATQLQFCSPEDAAAAR